ncbi:MAG TPA: hypothetical protein DEA97_13340 [Bacteroidales bacterium]|nr:hypothetical protein [Bacteroidales bacterium]
MIFYSIRIAIIKRKFQRLISNKYPKIRCNINYPSWNNCRETELGSVSVLNVLFSFGSKKKSRKYINAFVDVLEIEKNTDEVCKSLLNRIININSALFRIWLIMVIIPGLMFFVARIT